MAPRWSLQVQKGAILEGFEVTIGLPKSICCSEALLSNSKISQPPRMGKQVKANGKVRQITANNRTEREWKERGFIRWKSFQGSEAYGSEEYWRFRVDLEKDGGLLIFRWLLIRLGCCCLLGLLLQRTSRYHTVLSTISTDQNARTHIKRRP